MLRLVYRADKNVEIDVQSIQLFTRLDDLTIDSWTQSFFDGSPRAPITNMD